jgi:hypothetical protein
MTTVPAAVRGARFDAGQRLIRLGSGVLVLFVAFGFALWLCGACSWVGFYLGARGGTLVAVARVSTIVGFVGAVVVAVDWYRRRCRGGRADVPGWVAGAACLALPAGAIFWAIFVDAIAYHYGDDLVRPAFDYAIMPLVLGGVVPIAVGVPLLFFRFARGAETRGPFSDARRGES